MKYFDLSDDVHVPRRWHLGEITLPDGSEPHLRAGLPYEGPFNLAAEVTHPGLPLDFCLTSFAVPVARTRVAEAIGALSARDVQRIRVAVKGHGEFDVLNILRVEACLDEQRSEFIKWTKSDHRPDLAGQYRQVTKLRLDQGRLPPDAHIFRVDGWRITVIVSEWMKAAIESVGCVGAKFDEVD